MKKPQTQKKRPEDLLKPKPEPKLSKTKQPEDLQEPIQEPKLNRGRQKKQPEDLLKPKSERKLDKTKQPEDLQEPIQEPKLNRTTQKKQPEDLLKPKSERKLDKTKQPEDLQEPIQEPKLKKAAQKKRPEDLLKPKHEQNLEEASSSEELPGKRRKKRARQKSTGTKREPELTEADTQEREKLSAEQEERRRAIVEKMNTFQVSKRLREAKSNEAERERRKAKMFEETDRSRRISDDMPDKQEEIKDRMNIEMWNTKYTRNRDQVRGAFDGTPLGIFSEKPATEASPPVSGRRQLYDILQQEAEEKLYDYPPRNAWEEQIQWTRQGKLWTFPIDNEAGWDEEKNVSFQDHVFLERQLRDFPSRGPIRHFMELVTVALSKNPHMTVQEKHDHIDWFRQYFLAKENVLVGPLGDMGKFKDSPTSQST